MRFYPFAFLNQDRQLKILLVVHLSVHPAYSLVHSFSIHSSAYLFIHSFIHLFTQTRYLLYAVEWESILLNRAANAILCEQYHLMQLTFWRKYTSLVRSAQMKLIKISLVSSSFICLNITHLLHSLASFILFIYLSHSFALFICLIHLSHSFVLAKSIDNALFKDEKDKNKNKNE